MAGAEGLYPVRADVPWAREDGTIVVLLPKPLGPMARGLRAVTKGPRHLRVVLDEVGSRAFLLADGTRDAAALAALLIAEFGDRAGPRERAVRYLGTLAKGGLLRLAEGPVPAPAPGEPPQLACPSCGRRFHAAEERETRLRCPSCGGRMLA